MSKIAKFLVAASATVGIIASAMSDGVFTSVETEAIIVSAVGALFVYLVPNKPAPEPTA